MLFITNASNAEEQNPGKEAHRTQQTPPNAIGRVISLKSTA
jgi:hypothetical protein